MATFTKRSVAATTGQQPLFTRASVTPKTTEHRPNKYAGRCEGCGGQVAEGEGQIKSVGGKWLVHHLGNCPPVEEAPVSSQAVDSKTIFDGIYTVEVRGGHRTFKLRTQSPDADFKPGQQVVMYLSGSDNEHNYTSFGNINNGKLQVWKRHSGNVDLIRDANALFADPASALKQANCFACGRALTVPTSIHAGYGPECAKRRGW